MRTRTTSQRRRIAGATVVSLVLGTVVGLSLNYEGVATAEVDLNDGGVWVSNNNDLAMGRLNYPVQQIDAAMAAVSQNIDVLQREDVVFVQDLSGSTLQRVDAAQVATTGTVTPLPPQAEVELGEDTLGILSGSRTGEYYVLGLNELGAMDEGTAEPLATLGPGAAHAVADDGTAFGLDARTGELLTITPQLRAERSAAAENENDGDDAPQAEDAASEDSASEESASDDVAADGVEPQISQLEEAYFDEAAAAQLTAVGADPVALVTRQDNSDAVDLTVLPVDQDPVDLSDLDLDLASARLQAPSPDGDSVVIATSDALIEVPLRGQEPRVWPVTTPGPPVQPVQVGGCLHGAWSASVPLHLRSCGGEDPVEQIVPGAGAGADLTFRVNRHKVALNDMSTGDSWMLEDTLILVDNWEDITPPQDSQEEEEESLQEIRDEVPLDREAENQDPNAEPDEFGLRAGRTVLLPVLDNDSDPDGDLLTVGSFEQLPQQFGTVEPVMGGRALQIHVDERASGQQRFSYSADDGRGGSDSAPVTLQVVPAEQNNPPQQLRDISAEVASGGTIEVNVMDDVRDPDGDPIYLTGVDHPDSLDVLADPNGMITITDRGTEVGRKQIVVQVSDGRALADVVVDLEVLAEGSHPPTAVFDFATAFVGETITVEPLRNDVDPAGRPLRLSHVEQVPEATIVTDYGGGTFTFTSETADDYYLTYIVADDDGGSATGLIRISVIDEDPGAPPVAVGDTALLPPGGSVLVDVLENDFDPGGGVLAVQQIDVPQGYGLQVAIVDHRLLRISSDRSLTEPVNLTYTVSNGTRTATGEVQVLPLVHAESAEPPLAVRDTARVRAGDYVTIPVLANDSHPNGLEFSLDPELVEEPEAGLMFVAGDVVRFMAPDTPQTVSGVYRIVDENGQSHSATVTVNVVAVGEESNSPPVPEDVVARAFAGERVRIPVNTHGIDPDGDSVRLLGVESAPELGRIVDQGPGYLDYQPFTASVGVDTFSYAVQDRLGATATADITVGVIPPPETNRPPVAVPDEVTVRPGRQVQVDVLASDTDPDGDRLVFGDPAIVDDGGLEDVGIQDSLVLFTAPDQEDTYVLQYTVSDRNGGADVGTLTVMVDAEAEPQPPVAIDDEVPPDAIVGMETITAAVLENDYDPDGSVEALRLSVPEGNPTARVAANERELQIDLTPERQVITYRITDEDDLSSYAFVEVPGTEDTGPVKRSDSPALEVDSGAPLEIPLEDHVLSVSGGEVQLTDFSAVRATNSDGSELVVDAHTLTFTSAEGYYGPATITFEVTDSPDLNVEDLRTSVITLDIEVRSTENVPPQMRPGSLEVEAGGAEESLNLQRLAEDPDGQVHELTFELASVPNGFDARLGEANVLFASADAATPEGTTDTIEVEVTDPDGASVIGTVSVTATGSNRPLIVANDDDAGQVHQGESVTVDVLANDSNPFPGEPRTVLSAAVETGDADVSVSGDAVTFTPAQDYVGRLSIAYTVVDTTGDPDRQVQARVTAAVIGVPEAPRPPRVESVGNGQVVLTWSPPRDNGAPITSYQVEAGGVSQECQTTTCTITGLSNGSTYNFTVTATNEVGQSPASGPSGDARPDVQPSAPGAPMVEFGDGELTLSWDRPENEGTPITHYDVRISPGGGGSDQISVTGTSHTWTGLTNGQAYVFQVRAINDAPEPGEWSPWSAAEVPSGPPLQPQAPSATRVDVAEGGQLQVSWTEPDTNGDSIDQYYLYMYRNGEQQPVMNVGGSTRQRTVTVQNAYDYEFAVVAENRAGRSELSPRSDTVRSFGAPGRTQNVSAAPTGNNGEADVSYTAPNDNGQPISRYEYRLGGGTIRALPSSGTITGLTNGQSYTVQVRACNSYCGQWSAASSSFITYGPPGAPSVSSSLGSEERVQFSWTAPGGNGASIDYAEYRTRVNGGSWSSWQRANPSGTHTVRGDWEDTHQIQVRVTNNHGQTGPDGTSSRTARPDPNPESVSLVAERSAQGQPNCSTADCHFVDVRYANLDPGTYRVRYYRDGDFWRENSASLGSSGTYRSPSYLGYQERVRVEVIGPSGTLTDEVDWPNN